MVKKKTKKVKVKSNYTGKNLTDFIKIQLMKYYRFDRGFTFVCSECINNSDISALNDKLLVEVEIKISKQDFIREFEGDSKVKNYKHRVLQGRVKPRKDYIVPNYYYMCVPLEISDFVINYLKEHAYNNYGVFVCGEKRVFNKRSHIYSVKTAKKIHNKVPNSTVIRKVGQRVQSEMIGLKEKDFQRKSK